MDICNMIDKSIERVFGETKEEYTIKKEFVNITGKIKIQMINERMNKMCTLTIGIENFVADEKGFPKFLDEFFKKAIKGFRA